MTVLVFSDSHGSAKGMRKILSLQKELPGAVVFLGDGCREVLALEKEYSGRIPFYLVRGNCDSLIASEPPAERTIVLDGVRIFLCHGHTLGVKYGMERLAARAAEENCPLCFYGHTHIPADETLNAMGKNVRLICPGSISLPSCGKPTFCVLEIRGGEMLAGIAEFDG